MGLCAGKVSSEARAQSRERSVRCAREAGASEHVYNMHAHVCGTGDR